jgi:hypothetical protein
LVVSWPFAFVVNSDYTETGWAIVNGPIVTCAQQDEFARLRYSGYRFAGMSSYQTFPLAENGDPLDYESVCEAWCHCFREPSRFLMGGAPRALISVSDFTDHHRISPEVFSTEDEADFDFVYCGGSDAWKRHAKNWKLAAHCITAICRQLGLRCLVIGEPTDDFAAAPGVSFSPPLPWHSFLSHLAKARFLFAPNRHDASPRVLAEALCLNVPLVVHRDILGGWKYVSRFTGTFFDGTDDVVAQVRSCLLRQQAPRDWFRANHGPWVAGSRLLHLLRRVDPGISERSYLRISERIDDCLPQRPS